jgi:hypothetical protein
MEIVAGTAGTPVKPISQDRGTLVLKKDFKMGLVKFCE